MGARSMIKVVVLAKRAGPWTVDDLRTDVTSRHGAVVAELTALQRHVPSLALPGGYRRGEPVSDVVHELWFADEDAARAATSSEPFAELLASPSLDPGSVVVLLTEDHVIKAGDEGGVKNIEFVTRRADLPLPEFRRYWREVHGPLASRIGVMRRYVQSHCLPSCYERERTPAWDGLAITWFDDVAAMRVSATTAEYRETREDEPNFLAPGHLPFLITTEQ